MDGSTDGSAQQQTLPLDDLTRQWHARVIDHWHCGPHEFSAEPASCHSGAIQPECTPVHAEAFGGVFSGVPRC